METVKLGRDVEAVQIPAGHTVTLEKGWDVTITQSLGGSYTVQVPMLGGLFRIAGSDCGGGLVPTRTCSIEIVFEPSGAGPRTGRVAARTDTGLEPALVLLGGTGEVR
jgi:hypothetical protein